MGEEGSQTTKILRGQRLRWGTQQGEYQRKQAKIEEGPKIEIKTNHLPSFIAFLLFAEPIPCFYVQFRSHKKLFVSKSKHGCQQQDFNRQEERMETLQSEYS